MQSNKVMAPFRTKGWPYFDKMHDIMPNTTARGGHAFSAMRAMPPPSILEESVDDDVESRTHMNIYDDNESWTFTSTKSAGKRKLSAITPNDEMEADTPSITASPPLTSSTSFEDGPAAKKITNPSSLIGTSSSHARSIPKAISLPSSHSKPKSLSAPSMRSQQRSLASRTSAKLTPELLVHEMQGSITTLASAVRDSAATDPVAKLRQEAVHAISVRDDGLSVKDRITIIELLRTDYASVQTYLALLEHDEIRKEWLSKQLE